MREPYSVMIRAMCIFKAAGLRVPASTQAEKQRLLNIWVQRYGAADAAAFLAAARRLAGGRYFPRFCDMDAALCEAERTLVQQPEAKTKQTLTTAQREQNRHRLRQLIEHLAKR